jgi:hypothetical protein
VTFPLWVLPFLAGLLVVAIAMMFCGIAWDAASSLVEPSKPGKGGGKRCV